MHEQSFNPQPTARESLFYSHSVLSIATIRTSLDLSTINVESIVVEEGVCLGCLGQRLASPPFKKPSSTSTVSLSTSTSTGKSDAGHDRLALTVSEEETLHKSKTLDRALRSNALFVLLCRARAQSAAADGARARNRFELVSQFGSLVCKLLQTASVRISYYRRDL